jgi:hypothetical protein
MWSVAMGMRSHVCMKYFASHFAAGLLFLLFLSLAMQLMLRS